MSSWPVVAVSWLDFQSYLSNATSVTQVGYISKTFADGTRQPEMILPTFFWEHLLVCTVSKSAQRSLRSEYEWLTDVYSR